MLYCGIKYGQFFDFALCFQDPLCNFDFTAATCSAADSVIEEAVIDGLKVKPLNSPKSTCACADPHTFN